MERLRRKHERRQELQTSLRIQSPAPRIGGATVSSEQGDGAAKDLSVSFAASAAGSASSPGSSQTTRRQRLSTGTDGAFLRAGAAGSGEESESESDDEDSGDEHGREAIKQEMLSRVWQAVDADGNGSLDRAEIEKVLREMMGASDDGDVESTLDRLDLDGDGVLSFVRSPAPRAVILAERCCGARQEEFSTWCTTPDTGTYGAKNFRDFRACRPETFIRSFEPAGQRRSGRRSPRPQPLTGRARTRAALLRRQPPGLETIVTHPGLVGATPCRPARKAAAV